MIEFLQIGAVITAVALFLLFAYTFATVLVLPFTQGALFVPTSRVRIRAILDAVPMTANHLLIDLGCGDGRMLREAVRRYGACCIGYELNPFAYFMARLNCLGRKKTEIRMRNFYKADISQADVVFCYLFPDVLLELTKKLTRELKPGAMLVSCNFPVPGLAAEQVLHPGSWRHNDPIYIYRMPEYADRQHLPPAAR